MSKGKGTPLENINYLIILWMLSQAPSHGYEILTRFSRLFGKKFTSGALYPMLYKMERLGLIFSQRVDEGGRRVKRRYFMAEQGVRALHDFASKFGEFFEFMSKSKSDLIAIPTQSQLA